MHRVALVACKIRSHIVPVRESAQTDRLCLCGRFCRSHTLELADPVDKLEIIDVTLVSPALVRFDVTAVSPVELVHEGERISLPSVFRKPYSGNIFIPAGHEYKLRVEFIGSLPLLGYVPPVEIAVRPRVESVPDREIAAVGILDIESSAVALPVRAGVLSDSDCSLLVLHLAILVLGCDIAVLRIVLEPSPLVVAVRERTVHIVRLSGTEGEELLDFLIESRIGQQIRICHDAWLSLPHEPEIRISSRLVKVIVELAKRDICVRIEEEIEYETDLRHVHSIFLGLGPGFEKGLIRILEGQGTVGAVKENSIDTGIGKKFGMLAQNPLVCGFVVTQQRLLPEEETWFAISPSRMVVVLHSFRMLPYDLGDVLHRIVLRIVALMPGPIEDSDKLVILCRSFIVGTDLPSESVSCRPGITVDFLCGKSSGCCQQRDSCRCKKLDVGHLNIQLGYQ